MKKIILVFALGLLFLFIYQNRKNLVVKKGNSIFPKILQAPIEENKKENNQSSVNKVSIFVPYWSLVTDSANLANYKRFIYFGVTPNNFGINKEEPGYKNLEKFIQVVPAGTEKFITLRMTNQDFNLDLLENTKLQTKIIEETLDIVKKYKFNGIVLDLEINTIFNDKIKGQINDFVQQFYASAKKENLQFSITLFGDTLYRKRPYDLYYLSRHTDEILIMAYDFHKSKGEPGPNFPLSGRDLYGYDFQSMVDEFTAYVQREKITVVFGLYGYDWSVDEKRRPIKPSGALSLNEIKKMFLAKCEWKDCVVKRDDKSKETEVNYVIPRIIDNYAYLEYHIVWFEDEESATIKKDYLLKKGIGSLAYWAYGYF